MEKLRIIQLTFKEVKDFKGDHKEAIIVMNEEGDIGYGIWEKDESYEAGSVLLNDLSAMVIPAFISSIHDVVGALNVLKPVEKEKETAVSTVGIISTYIWKEERIHEIREAMRRYLAEDKLIPANWLNELTDLYIDLNYN